MIFRTNQHDYFRYPLTIRHEHRNFCILYLSELGRHQLVKLDTVCGRLVEHNDKLAKEIKNKRITISNDTLIIVRFSIKVDKHPYGGISPLIFP